VAQARKRKKPSWLRRILLFILIPLVVWFVAFLLWFFWQGTTKLFTKEHQDGRPASESGRKVTPSSQKAAGEKILDEDRRKLDDIIKQKQ
jgi:cytoskeletal protein RodZ